jgi:hypothetical protein
VARKVSFREMAGPSRMCCSAYRGGDWRVMAGFLLLVVGPRPGYIYGRRSPDAGLHRPQPLNPGQSSR